MNPPSNTEHERAGSDPSAAGVEAELIRHEEQLVVGAERREAVLRAGKRVESYVEEHTVPRTVEQLAELERRPAESGDSGQIETLEDGSISIPLLEEEIVVTKRVVVRERVIIRKEAWVEHERVQATLRTEHLELSADPGVTVVGDVDETTTLEGGGAQ